MTPKVTRRLAGLLAAGLLGFGPARAQMPAPVFDFAYGFGSAVPVTSGSNAAIKSVGDAQGNVYVCGQFTGTATFGSTTLTSRSSSTDIFVAKLTPTGQWAWAVAAGGSQGDGVADIALDNAGSVYLTGGVQYDATFGTIAPVLPALSAQEVFVAKLSPAGQWQWVSTGGGPYSDLSSAIAVDAAGNSYIAGSLHSIQATFGSLSLSGINNNGLDVFVAKLNPAGQWQWVRTTTNQTGRAAISEVCGVVPTASGDVYVAGGFTSSTLTLGATTLTNAAQPGTNTRDVFVARLGGATGQWQWATRVGGTAADYAYGLGQDAAGNLYLGGELQSPAVAFGGTTLGVATSSGFAGYVAKLSAAGQWQWATQSGQASSTGGNVFGRALAVAADGSSYLAGAFANRPTFGATTLSSNGGNDVYAAKLSPAGQWEWAVAAGGSSSELVYGIGLDATGNAVLTGAFSSPTINFGSTQLVNMPSTINNMGFVARLASVVTALPTAAERVAFAVWPNPAQSSAAVTLPPRRLATELLVLNALGQPVRRQVVAPGDVRAGLALTGLAPGLYLVQYGPLTRRLLVE